MREIVIAAAALVKYITVKLLGGCNKVVLYYTVFIGIA